ncbi:MAG: type II secretion system protein [Alphaproteobacteria bacterium]|nr:type II secretion system protein [Alphaproteobacteria bacterium]
MKIFKTTSHASALEHARKPSILGFSLVELSIVLSIIAVIAGGALTVGAARTKAAKYEQTAKKMEIIEKAVASYLAIRGKVPCPAIGSTAQTVSTFGFESDTASDPDHCTGVPQDGNAWVGVVPVRTLLLPDEFMFDGWGRRITYAVDDRFVSKCALSTSTTCFRTSNPEPTPDTFGDALVVRSTFTDTTNIRTNKAIFVLVSHGENGHGAWLRTGGSQLDAGSTDVDEWANSHRVVAEGGTPDRIFVQKARNETFDDLIRYKTKWQLVREAGAVIDDEECIIADKVVATGSTDSPTNICNGSAVTDCIAKVSKLAAKVQGLCLQ